MPKVEWDKETLKKIEQKSYFKWVNAGKPHGQEEVFWSEAEQEMKKECHYDAVEEDIIEVNFKSKDHVKSGWIPVGYYDAIPLNTTTEVVHAKKRKLKAVWTSQIT